MIAIQLAPRGESLQTRVRAICNSLDSAPVTANPAATHPGSINRKGVFNYLRWADEAQSHGDLLYQLYKRRKEGKERQAIWSGYWAVAQGAKNYIETLRDRGGLLYFGQAAALEVARQWAEAYE